MLAFIQSVLQEKCQKCCFSMTHKCVHHCYHQSICADIVAAPTLQCQPHGHIFTWLVFWKMSCEDATTRRWGTEKCRVPAAGENEKCFSLVRNTCSCLKVEKYFWQRWRVRYIEKWLCLQQCCSVVLWNVHASNLHIAWNKKQKALFWLISM